MCVSAVWGLSVTDYQLWLLSARLYNESVWAYSGYYSVSKYMSREALSVSNTITMIYESINIHLTINSSKAMLMEAFLLEAWYSFWALWYSGHFGTFWCIINLMEEDVAVMREILSGTLCSLPPATILLCDMLPFCLMGQLSWLAICEVISWKCNVGCVKTLLSIVWNEWLWLEGILFCVCQYSSVCIFISMALFYHVVKPTILKEVTRVLESCDLEMGRLILEREEATGLSPAGLSDLGDSWACRLMLSYDVTLSYHCCFCSDLMYRVLTCSTCILWWFSVTVYEGSRGVLTIDVERLPATDGQTYFLLFHLPKCPLQSLSAYDCG